MANHLENALNRDKKAGLQTIVLADGPLKGQEWEVGADVLGVYIPTAPGSKRSHHYRCRDGKWVFEPREGM